MKTSAIMINDAGVMLARLKGKAAAITPEPADIDAFCDRLRGYTFEDWTATKESPDLTPLPTGFRNLRVFDSRDGVELGSYWQIGSAATVHRAHAGTGAAVGDRPATAHHVVSICLSKALEEVVAWHETKALPVTEAGVLDLLVDIETRPRELLFWGDPLPPGAREAIARLAPRRL